MHSRMWDGELFPWECLSSQIHSIVYHVFTGALLCWVINDAETKKGLMVMSRKMMHSWLGSLKRVSCTRTNNET